MKKYLFPLAIMLLFGSLSSFAQDINVTDAKGRRQGLWTDFYSNGQRRYEGNFKNGRCTGEFRYYDEQGVLQATNTFDKSGSKALNKCFAPDGTLIATGYYVDQKKEGEWRYFSKDNGKLILVEDNKDGKVHGWSRVYNPLNERVAEEAQYVDGLREGQCREYYDSGVLMMECSYHEGQLSGYAKTYYPSGALKEEGDFLNGDKTGVWKTYNEDGDEVSSDRYGE